MTSQGESKREAERLEQLWSGEFGDAYVERNRAAGVNRDRFWRPFLASHPVERVLEVGCNLGANLKWIAEVMPGRSTYGVDVNEKALAIVRSALPAVNAVYSTARELPFRDGYFDLVFTMGVLIHQPLEGLDQVMAEIVRCSRRYVLCVEYFASEPVEVPYRGERGALHKLDFGARYLECSADLKLVERRPVGKDEGCDDCELWLFEKPRR